MATKTESLADFQRGRLSLEDFAWEPHLRPSSSSISPTRQEAADVVPEVDLLPLYNPAGKGGAKYAEMVENLAEAASTHGFFQVFNHGIRVGALESLYEYGRKFFSLPLDRKYEASQFSVHPSAGPNKGWNEGCSYMCGNYSSCRNKWWIEGIRLPYQDKTEIHTLASSFCPDDQERQQFSDVLEECSFGFSMLAQRLIMLLLERLGLTEEDVLKKYVDDGGTAPLKLSHYPPCPQPNKILGLPSHSDVSILTLLWQDQVGGLQMKANGGWMTIKPRPDALVVNIGDVFQVWSNDQYVSGLHRVVLNTKESRYSMAYFCYSSAESMLKPIPEVLDQRKQCSKFQSTLLSEHRRHAYSEINEGYSKGVQYLKAHMS